ncbi:uncharacterized protein PSANT_05159 [Moesziomyces antarcticus]|uniref:Myb-like domain-containing protein n=1 Tax=Pseudozyma antarctica TaxID=84753 RepID=A0A5C3FV56_PSEA2|nr:uncharacterized protein PSANT_05159 [Moesziomyces antarcticus]
MEDLMRSYCDDESEGFDIEDLVDLAYSDHSSDDEQPMATCPTAPPSREESDQDDESDEDTSSNEDEVRTTQEATSPVEINSDSEDEEVPPSTPRAAAPLVETPPPPAVPIETSKAAVRATAIPGRGTGRGRGRGRGGSTAPATPRNERPSSSFSSPSTSTTSSGGTSASTPASSQDSLPTKSSPASPSPEGMPRKRKRTLSQLTVPAPSDVAANMGDRIVQAIAAAATPVTPEKTYKRKPKPAPAASEPFPQPETPALEAGAKQPEPVGGSTNSPKTTSPKKASRSKPTRKTGHWTREEMMLLFHEVFPRKYDLAWDVVARAVGRDETECSAKVPALISELEDFLSA